MNDDKCTFYLSNFSKMLINNVKIGKISFSVQERVYDTFGK
ncbi:hypothetical protein SDB_00993 [Shigella dysenteriae CDC 74-1112]|nr:hypothetical protein SDB_00993 [Shigella dysenteriae CDC 74-1112]EIQ62332.1 hypothetical protein SD22575_1361 [Shigella dysenteriae 225-75]